MNCRLLSTSLVLIVLLTNLQAQSNNYYISLSDNARTTLIAARGIVQAMGSGVTALASLMLATNVAGDLSSFIYYLIQGGSITNPRFNTSKFIVETAVGILLAYGFFVLTKKLAAGAHQDFSVLMQRNSYKELLSKIQEKIQQLNIIKSSKSA